MPQPLSNEVINYGPVLRNGSITCYEAAEEIDRQTIIGPMLDSCVLNNLTVRRVPLAPLTQHRSATSLRSQCHPSPHNSPCVSPRSSEQHIKINPELRSALCSPPLYTPFGSQRRTLNQSPHRPVMSPNILPNKNNETPCQWVLLDDPLERPSSPEVLHLCEECDEEFNSIVQLRIHSQKCCKADNNSSSSPQFFRQAKQQTHVKRQPPPTKAKTVKRQRPRPRPKKKASPAWDRMPIASSEFISFCAPPKKQAVLKKESFLHVLGLQETQNASPVLPVLQPPSGFKVLPNVQSMNLYRSVPFTHLPPSLRLRNSSFYPSQRAETHNAELIAVNWRKMDNACPAYPECHRKFVNYVQRTSPLLKSKTTVLGSQALALKRSLKQPRLVLRRLTSAEIHLAILGVNTQKLLKEKPLQLPCSRSRSRSRPRPKSRKPAPASRKNPAPSVMKPKFDDVQTAASSEEIKPVACASRLQCYDVGEPTTNIDRSPANVIPLQIGDTKLISLIPRVVLTRLSEEDIAWWRSRDKIQPPSLTPRPANYENTDDKYATLIWHEEDGVIVIDD